MNTFISFSKFNNNAKKLLTFSSSAKNINIYMQRQGEN